MPHRSESGLAGMHNELTHEFVGPSEAMIIPGQRDYRVPMRSYASNGWEVGYDPNIERSFVSCPQFMVNRQIESSQQSLGTCLRNGQATVVISKGEVDEKESTLVAKKDDQESPASWKESFSVTSESSYGSSIISGLKHRKKRKKHLDVLRRNRCWLPIERGDTTSGRTTSPVSSVGSVNNDNQSELASSTPPTTHELRSYGHVGAATQVLPNEAAHYQAVANFPNVLLMVLYQSEENESVLQWLEPGHAWRVVRWDALRRSVLPRYFPQLCQPEDNGSNGGSIDAFLWNVRAWGFEEIKDGPDAGAYAHKHFLRDDPKRIEQMQISFITSGEETGKSFALPRPSDAPASQEHEANLLQVPSLATTRSDGSAENKQPEMTEKFQHWHHRTHEEYSRSNIPYYDMYHGSTYGWHFHVNTVHHPDDPSMGGHHFQSLSAFQHGVICPSPYDARYPFRPHPDSNGSKANPSATASSIRSGRGGSRIGIHISQSEVDRKRTSFPVSQRGKGPRGASTSCRTVLSDQRRPGMEDGLTSLNILSESASNVDNNARSAFPPSAFESLGRKSKKSMLLERSLASDFSST